MNASPESVLTVRSMCLREHLKSHEVIVQSAVQRLKTVWERRERGGPTDPISCLGGSAAPPLPLPSCACLSRDQPVQSADRGAARCSGVHVWE